MSKQKPTKLLPSIPDAMPKAGGVVRRWLGRNLLRLSGWELSGELPDEPKLVLAAAPHTSNWDFILAMFVTMALGIRISYLMKKEAFIWPFRGLFMRLGGIPIDRSAAQNLVDQIVSWYREHDKVWVVITPEGTRSKVDKWKTGFLRVAQQAEVPVCLVSWDYPSKTMYVGPVWSLTGDHEQDVKAIRRYISENFTGKYPDKQ